MHFNDQSRVRRALDHIPADDRNTWLEVGMSLHSTGWPDAFYIWDSWSRTSDQYVEGCTTAQWKSFRADRGKTIATLYHVAKKCGWDGKNDSLPGPPVSHANGTTKPVATKATVSSSKEYWTIEKAEEAILCGIQRDEAYRGCTGFRVKSFPYYDKTGRVVTAAIRVDYCNADNKPDKTFRMLWSGNGRYAVGGMEGSRPLYELPLVAKAETVIVVEGEKCADALNQLFGSVARTDVVATTSICGAQSPSKTDWSPLAGKQIYVWPDSDEAGEKYLESVAGLVGCPVKVIRPDNMPPKGDACDWLNGFGPFSDSASPHDIVEHFEKLLADALTYQTETATNDIWPEVVPFTEQDLPLFPLESLPDVLRNWVIAESIATQTPPDLTALMSLAACGALLAKKVEIEPRIGWREPVNIFVAVLLEPANRKTSVVDAVVAPLRDIETQMIDDAMPEVIREKSRRRQDEARIKKLEKLAVDKSDPEAARQAQDLSVELALRPIPAEPKLLCDDATDEKIGIMLAEQNGRLASMSAEGGVFDLMSGKYSSNGGTNFEAYLKGHAGDTIVTDRVSRASLRVDRPALTCAYAIQPHVIRGLADQPAFRGRGLLARFLYAAPRSWIGERAIAPPPVPDDVRKAYYETMERLNSVNCVSAGEALILRLDSEASSALGTFEREVESSLADGGDFESIRDWAGKLVGAAMRIAAILHCVEFGVDGKIGVGTIRAAVRIAKFLAPHADYVLRMLSATNGGATDDSLYLLRWIQRHELKSFTKRDAYQHGRRRFPQPDDMDPALAELTRRGYVRPVVHDTSGPGRPSSPEFEVNPAVFENENPGLCTHNSQNSGNGEGEGNSVNCVYRPEGFENEDFETVTL